MEAAGLSDSEIRNLYLNLELLLELSRKCQQSKAGYDVEAESGSRPLSVASTEQTRSPAYPAASEDEANYYSNQHSLRRRHIGDVVPDEDDIPGRDTTVRNSDEPARQSTALGQRSDRKQKSNEGSSTLNHKKMRSDAALQQHSRRETFVSNTFASISFPTYDAIDLEQFLINSKTVISSIISEELIQRKALKYYLSYTPRAR